jgi:hypothetical protein
VEGLGTVVIAVEEAMTQHRNSRHSAASAGSTLDAVLYSLLARCGDAMLCT